MDAPINKPLGGPGPTNRLTSNGGGIQPERRAPREIHAAPTRFTEASRFFARLNRYQMILRKFWWLLLICIGLSAVGVRLYTVNLPPLYESKAKMWFRGKLNVLPEGRTANDELASQVELLQSAVVQRKAFEEIRRTRPELNLVGTNVDRSPEPPFKLTVKEIPKAGVFDLRAVGPNPESPQAFLDALMVEFQEFKKQDRIKTSDSAQKSVGSELQRLEKQIYDTEEKARRYQIDNKLLVFQEQGSGAASYLARINRQLAILRMEKELIGQMDAEQVAELGERMMDNKESDVLPGQDTASELLRTLAGPQADSFKASQQLGLLKLKRDQLAKYLRPAHPKMVRLEKGIIDQEKIIEIFRSQGAQQLRNRESALKIQIKSLEDAYKEWETKAAESSVKLAEYDRIQKEVQRYQGFYDRLMTAVQTVDLSKNMEQESFGVLDPASIGQPVNRAAKAQLLGLVMGFFFGLGLLYLLEQFDDRFSSVSELRSQLSEQVVGQIPDLGGRRSKKQVPVLYPSDSRHAFAESFMTLRSALQFTFSEGERPRTMVVTSSVPGEGKTTVSTNLAITLALAGARVLIIDADLRRSTVHKLLNLPNSPGFAEIL
ncbi:MAG: P-loop NTPase, partial [Verrucomicrobiota bacterium]